MSGDGLDLPDDDEDDESELVGTEDMAAMWKLNREYVTNHIVKLRDFPAPALNLTRRIRRWSRVDVEAWRKKHSGKR